MSQIYEVVYKCDNCGWEKRGRSDELPDCWLDTPVPGGPVLEFCCAACEGAHRERSIQAQVATMMLNLARAQ